MARYQKVINLIEEIAHDEGIDMDQFDAAIEKIAAEVKAFPNMNREQRACWQEVELWKRTFGSDRLFPGNTEVLAGLEESQPKSDGTNTTLPPRPEAESTPPEPEVSAPSGGSKVPVDNKPRSESVPATTTEGSWAETAAAKAKQRLIGTPAEEAQRTRDIEKQEHEAEFNARKEAYKKRVPAKFALAVRNHDELKRTGRMTDEYRGKMEKLKWELDNAPFGNRIHEVRLRPEWDMHAAFFSQRANDPEPWIPYIEKKLGVKIKSEWEYGQRLYVYLEPDEKELDVPEPNMKFLAEKLHNANELLRHWQRELQENNGQTPLMTLLEATNTWFRKGMSIYGGNPPADW